MRKSRGIFLICVMYGALVPLFITQSAWVTTSNSPIIVVQSPLSEMTAGYLKWLHQHPQASNDSLEGSQTNTSKYQQNSGLSLRIEMPSLDLFSTSGKSLYHGTNSEKNADFIHALRNSHVIGNRLTKALSVPTLEEAIAIFPELNAYKNSVLGKKMHTLFTVTYPGTSMCKAQNDALDGFKYEAWRDGIRIIVVQVQLQK